jgi:hypothetical protein
MAMDGKREVVEELRQLLGDIDDEKAAEILALEPTPEELEIAVLWAQGNEDIVSTRGIALSPKTGRIFDILTEGEDEDQR